MNEAILARARAGQHPTESEARALAGMTELQALLATANDIRDSGFGNTVTFSKKVFIPLTHLCRDVCHYCTFAKAPKRLGQPYMSIEQVLEVAREGARMGCKEALFTLGERPELRDRKSVV